MTESTYTIRLNGSVYELNESVRGFLQECTERAYAENEYVSTWWKTSNGDPTLVIETSGHLMPFDRIDQFHPDDDFDDDEPEAHFMQSPEKKDNVEQPEIPEDDTIPAMPSEMPEHDVLVGAVPRDERYSQWAVGRALAPMQGIYERNYQSIVLMEPVSEDGYGSMNGISDELAEGIDNAKSDNASTRKQAHWESILRLHGCEKLRDVKAEDTSDSAKRRPDSWHDKKKPGSAKKGQVGNRYNL